MQPDMSHVPSTTLIQIDSVHQSPHFCNDRQIEGAQHKNIETKTNLDAIPKHQQDRLLMLHNITEHRIFVKDLRYRHNE